jgi:predicted HTH transcriptional regulator
MLHITNLIKQHIGLEFNNYIHIESISVSGKDVVKIEVNKAPYPAYLHMNDKEEEFYIRSGPSTVSLRISKAVKYIIENKKIREKS